MARVVNLLVRASDERKIASFVRRLLKLPTPYRQSLVSLAEAFESLESEDCKQKVFDQMCTLAKSPSLTEKTVAPECMTGCDEVGLDKFRKVVGQRVYKIRTSLGWTQAMLARKANLHQSHISRIEAFDLAPTFVTIQKIAKACNVSCGDIDPQFLED